MIATVGVDDDGQAYNVNADTVAGAIAEALDAEKLVYLTDVAGVYGDWPDEASLISRIDVDGLEQLDRRRARSSEGMIPKLESCVVGAAAAACARAHILDGRLPHALLLEFFTREGVGTMVRPMSESTHDTFDELARARRRARDADLRPPAGRVRARRGHAALGQRGQASTSTSSAGSRSRRSATRTRRSPTRSPTRRARCCTCRTSTTTTCSRRSRRGSTRCSAAAAACSSPTRAPRPTSARSSSPAGTASATAAPSAST